MDARIESTVATGRRARAGSVAALAVALLAAFLLGRVSPEQVADLKPRPDAVEYEEAARGLLRGDGTSLRIDGRRFAPRYPPAMSWAVAGAMRLAGERPGSGAVVALLSALVSVAAAWMLAAGAGGPVAAAVAALVVALSPLHVRWSRAVMADVPSTAACALVGLWSLRRAARDDRSAAGDVASGVAAGLLSLLRLASLAIAPAVVATAALGPAPGGVRQRVERAARTAVGVAAGLLPLAVHQARAYGAPWRTGYGLWHGSEFSVDFASRPAFGATGELANPAFYAKVLAGGGDLHPWPVALLAAAGFLAAVRGPAALRSLAFFSAILLVSLLALHVPFFWQWDRFLLPALPFLAALAGCGAAAIASRTRPHLPAALLLLALAMLAWRGAWRPIEDAATESAWLRTIEAALPPDAVLLVRTDPFHFREILRDGRDEAPVSAPGRTWVPLGLDAHRAAIRLWNVAPLPARAGEDAGDAGRWTRDVLATGLAPADASKAIAALLDEGRPVYVATSPRDFEVPEAPALFGRLLGDFALEPSAALGEWHLWRVAGPSPVRATEASVAGGSAPEARRIPP